MDFDSSHTFTLRNLDISPYIENIKEYIPGLHEDDDKIMHEFLKVVERWIKLLGTANDVYRRSIQNAYFVLPDDFGYGLLRATLCLARRELSEFLLKFQLN